MTWIAIADHSERRLSLRGLGEDKCEKPLFDDRPETLLNHGTLLMETRPSPDGRPQVLFGYKNPYPHLRSLTFQAVPGGGISMVQVHGEAISHAAISYQNRGRTDVLRIIYSWDIEAGWARLTLERPEDEHVVTVPVANPHPLTLEDIRDLMLGRRNHTFAPDMIFAALSDRIEPIGPAPTLHPETPLATPWGYRPVSQLRRGDTVLTQGGDVVPVLHRVNRTVPARGSFRPLRLRAPYFGLQQDVVVAPDQRLRIDGPEVEYLFNEEAVLVPARHLVNGFAALEEPVGPVTTYTQLVLPGHDTVLAGGTALESLYIGRIRRNAQRLASSVLHDADRSSLPEHGRPGHQVLKWYEAIHLARRRAA